MSRARRLYRGLDSRVRSLSRLNYALLMVLVSGLSYFGVGALLGDASPVGAVAIGLTMGTLYYAFDPR